MSTIDIFDANDWENVRDRIIELTRTDNLLCNRVGQWGVLSHSHRAHTPAGTCGPSLGSFWRKIFRPLYLEQLETVFIIGHGWLLGHGVNAFHDLHGNGRYKGNYRLILSLGCTHKYMVFGRGPRYAPRALPSPGTGSTPLRPLHLPPPPPGQAGGSPGYATPSSPRGCRVVV